jgi:hypothetical protein
MTHTVGRPNGNCRVFLVRVHTDTSHLGTREHRMLRNTQVLEHSKYVFLDRPIAEPSEGIYNRLSSIQAQDATVAAKESV